MAKLKIFSEEQKQINRNTAFKIISKAKTELEQKLEWLVFKGSGAILRAYKFLYKNELLFELEKENFEKLETLEFPPELASQLIERAISFKREDLIPTIKENIKRVLLKIEKQLNSMKYTYYQTT